MSTQTLTLGESPIKLNVTEYENKIMLKLYDHKQIAAILLDRGQAHLLMLYLQEKLK